MKKSITLFFTITLLTSLTYAQKCKYERNELDDFTGKKVMITKMKGLTASGMGYGGHTEVGVSKYDDVVYLNLDISFPKVFSVDINNQLFIKFVGGDILKLNFANDDISEPIPGGASMFKIKGKFLLTLVDIQTLKDNRIEKIRIYERDSYMEEDVKKKRNDIVSKLLNCLD